MGPRPDRHPDHPGHPLLGACAPAVEPARAREERGLPARLLVGIALVAMAWPLSWGLPGMRTHVLFFPLWLGYTLAVDGMCLRRRGTSLLSRAGRGSPLLFLASVPVWWLFELANQRLQNWEYVGREIFSDLEYALLCSLSFSTVIPAVFTSAELVRGFGWVERLRPWKRVPPSPALLRGSFVAGLVLAALMIAWPRAFYPFLWMSGVFLLEPICCWTGRPSLLTDLARGDWRPWVSLWIGVLVCGFFWEMWNVHSMPKWIYHIPGADFVKVFEMPILGYLGYLPFALELYLLACLFLPERLRPQLERLPRWERESASTNRAHAAV